MVFSDALTHFDEAEVLSLITDDIEAIAKGCGEGLAMDVGLHFLFGNRDAIRSGQEMAEVVVGDKDLADFEELDPIAKDIEVTGVEMLIKGIELAAENLVASRA